MEMDDKNFKKKIVKHPFLARVLDEIKVLKTKEVETKVDKTGQKNGTCNHFKPRKAGSAP